MLVELTSNEILYSERIEVNKPRGKKDNHILTISSICLFCITVLILIFVYVMRNKLKKQQGEIDKYSKLLNEAESEMERLKTLCSNNTLNKEIRDIIKNYSKQNIDECSFLLYPPRS